jgi:2-hydroxy-3-oxopropionate reductase
VAVTTTQSIQDLLAKEFFSRMGWCRNSIARPSYSQTSPNSSETALRSGHSVVGYNRSAGPLDELVGLGGHAAASIAQAVADADVVMTMLPDTPDVLDVVAGEGGVFDSAKPGTLLIDFSTIAPEAAVRLASTGLDYGIAVLDAPVSGVGATVVHAGTSGAGQIVKAANQLIVAGQIALLAEALVFLEGHGVDVDAAFQAISGGLAASTVMSRKATNMSRRSFEPSFRLALHHKDMGIALAAARNANVTLPVGALVAQLMGSANARGYGNLDHSVLLKVVEQLSPTSAQAG